MTIFRFIVAAFAIVLILIGMVTAITPVPLGLPLIFVGFLLLATISPATLRFIRRRWGWLDRRLKWLQRKLPRWMTRSLRKSDPHPDKDEEEKEEDEETANDDLRSNEGLADILRRRGRRSGNLKDL